ncbi:hypothetical protein [Profundibacter sp.]
MKQLSKENAASGATEYGVYDFAKCDISPANNSPKRVSSAMAKYGKTKHKRIAKMLGCVLTLGRVSDWHCFTISLLANLSEAERAALAFASLNSLGHDNAYKTASLSLFGVLNGEVA